MSIWGRGTVHEPHGGHTGYSLMSITLGLMKSEHEPQSSKTGQGKQREAISHAEKTKRRILEQRLGC